MLSDAMIVHSTSIQGSSNPNLAGFYFPLREHFRLHFARRVSTLIALLIFLQCIFVSSGLVYAANAGGTPVCASSPNVVINELKPGTFFEIFVLKSDVSLSGMYLKHSAGGSSPTTYTVGTNVGASSWRATRFDNVSSPYSNSATYSAPTWIQYTSNVIDKKSDAQIALFDNAGKVLDMVTLTTAASCNYANTYWANPGTCNSCVSGVGASIKDYYRLPDGTGGWTNSSNGNSQGNANGTQGTSNIAAVAAPPSGGNGFFSYCVNQVSSSCSTGTVTAAVNLVYQSTTGTPICGSPFLIPMSNPVTAYTANIGAPTAGTGTSSAATMTWAGSTSANTTAAQKTLTFSGVNGDSSGNFTFAVSDATYPNVRTSTTVALACNSVAPVFLAYEPSYTAADAIAGTAKIKTHVASATGLCVSGGACTLKIGTFNAGKTALDTTFTGPVKVEIVDASSGSCATYASIATISSSLAMSAGQATVTLPAVANSYPNAGIRISYPASGSGVTPSCLSDNFAIRPNSFVSVAANDADWTTAGTTNVLNNASNTGTIIHRAGQPFRLSATAVNASNGTTSNYAGSAEAVLSTCSGTACSATLGTLEVGASFASGVLSSVQATYDNVGAVSAVLRDSTFADIDAVDSTPAERYITSGALTIGRFVPDHFDVDLNSPQFAPACNSGNFTYIGQPFGYATAPSITVTALNANNDTTTAYTGSLWHLPATLTGTYSTVSGTLSSTSGTGSITDNTDGSGLVDFSGNTLTYTRSLTPVARFNADITLSAIIADSDNVTFAGNPVMFGSTSADNGIPFGASGNTGKSMLYGQAFMFPGYGSEQVSLVMPIQLQYWTGNGFAVNNLDTCTAITPGMFSYSNWRGSLTAGSTSVTAVTNLLGKRLARMPAPGVGRAGSVSVTLNLSGNGLGYLQTRRPGSTSFTDNPQMTANFGLHGNSQNATNVIDIREVF